MRGWIFCLGGTVGADQRVFWTNDTHSAIAEPLGAESLTESLVPISRSELEAQEQSPKLQVMTGAQAIDAIDALDKGKALYILLGARWCSESRRMQHILRENTIVKPEEQVFYVDIDKDKGRFATQMSIETVPTLVRIINHNGLIETADYLGPSIVDNVRYWILQQEALDSKPISGGGLIPIVDDVSSEQWNWLKDHAVLSAECDRVQVLKQVGHPPADLILIQDESMAHEGVCSLQWYGRAFEPSIKEITSENVQNLPEKWEDLLTDIPEPLKLDSHNIHWINNLPEDAAVLLALDKSDQMRSTLRDVLAKLRVHTRVQTRLKETKILAYQLGFDTPYEKRFADYLGLSTLLKASTGSSSLGDKKDGKIKLSPGDEKPSRIYLLKSTKLFLPKYSMMVNPVGYNIMQYTDGLKTRKLVYEFSHDKFSTNFPSADEIAAWLTETDWSKERPILLKNERRPFRFNQGAALMEVNASTLQRIWMDPESNVITLIYTPWSSHSQMLLGEFRRVAEIYSSTLIPFVTFNAATNDLPPLLVHTTDGDQWMIPTVNGYPSIFVKSAQLDSLVDYVGERDADSIEQYVAETFRDVLIPSPSSSSNSQPNTPEDLHPEQ
ncbi:putative PDIa family, carboxy-terminal TRX domain (A') subfamily protein [Gregarina niphandrodes]|uniref:PDIa family, carboxy-terminal TRX domain (A') subfamily protein n=1 Tax=Gregarina niphandrodes TaxID=110365 RepID=A0A023B4W2_GRENI|nr:putative PDIa family, carboxy-terminal TRX domain (A') subfamily protein [Gregarina niphandrodes]EZG57772.1 putative PDIa family, carboxy-terminal TRX domain (A') subfamily protein [Gregarina niphandrodes]|eukprot:XP_011131036.1 putative PDIa family, carboxy-terminal TRX domain (A') subfamily protein [Gregarina niphandrodes]